MDFDFSSIAFLRVVNTIRRKLESQKRYCKIQFIEGQAFKNINYRSHKSTPFFGNLGTGIPCKKSIREKKEKDNARI